MRAIEISRPGPPSVLRVVEKPDPVPGHDEVRINVAAAGLNFAEVSARQGLYPDMPPTPCVVGYEVAGVIDQVGAGVDDFVVGQRVLGLTRFGGHASSVVMNEKLAFAIPDDMSFAQAAAVPVNYLTAHHMLFYVGTVHPGTSVLLHMASGGVGTAVLQLLQTVDDVTVYGTASARKHDYIRNLGCDFPIDYKTKDYFEEVMSLTDGRGVDIVLDPLGGEAWKRSWNLLAPAGRMVAFGFANAISGEKRNVFRVLGQVIKMPFITPMKALDENRSIQGVNLGHLWDEYLVLRRQMERLIVLFSEGVVAPHIHAEVPFAEVAEAHRMLETGQNRGKVVLVP